MLVLSRFVGEKIVVGENITIVVSRILPGRVVLGVQAPRNVVVMREELLDPNSPHPRFTNQENDALNATSEITSVSAEPCNQEFYTEELVIEFDDESPSQIQPAPAVSTKKSNSSPKPKKPKIAKEPQVATPERVMARQSLRDFAKALLKADPNAKAKPTDSTYETSQRQSSERGRIELQQEPLLPQEDVNTSTFGNSQKVSEPMERCA